MTYANGAVAENDYDTASRLTALRNLKSDRSVISIFTYTHDATGNRLGVAEASGDLVSWSYDETYQLTREQRTGTNSYDITYTYDEVGNRLTKLESGVTTTSSYDVANQLLTTEDASGVTTSTYDANGNTLTEEKPNSDLTTYTWDIENHVTKVELPASVVNTITLDGDGKRRTIEDSAGLKKLIWDAENILAETDSGDTTTASYTLAPEQYGSLISQRRSGTTAFHHFDALGSTNKLTDSSANAVAEYLYKAFGEQSLLSGSSANPFTWVGRQGYYRQTDAQDYWVRARVMKPTRAGWLSRDPARQGQNHYMYSANYPLRLTDPSGKFAILGRSKYTYTSITTPPPYIKYVDSLDRSLAKKMSAGHYYKEIAVECEVPFWKDMHICDAETTECLLRYVTLFVGYKLYELAVEVANAMRDDEHYFTEINEKVAPTVVPTGAAAGIWYVISRAVKGKGGKIAADQARKQLGKLFLPGTRALIMSLVGSGQLGAVVVAGARALPVIVGIAALLGVYMCRKQDRECRGDVIRTWQECVVGIRETTPVVILRPSPETRRKARY